MLEPNPDKYEIINSKIKEIKAYSDSNIIYYPLAVGSQTGRSKLHCFSGRSSGLASILKPNTSRIRDNYGRDSLELSSHGGGVDKPYFEHLIYISTLNKIVRRHREFKHADLLVIDTQGYELEVLYGFKTYIKNVKSIDLEVTIDKELSFYENNPSEKECSDFLENYGFNCDITVASFWGHAGHGRLLYRNRKWQDPKFKVRLKFN